ncbi:MAG: hypothetical protein ACFB9M_07565 [Myxococcota bacterium]
MTEISELGPCPIAFEGLPEAVQRNVGDQAPAPIRMMTARGMAPMAPSDLVTAQFILRWDGDDKIRTAAEKSLQNLDPRLANAVLSDTKLHSEVLAHLSSALAREEMFLEKLLLNPALPASAVVGVARTCSERIVSDHIVTNQARLLQEPEIVRAVIENPAAIKSDVERAVDFLIRNGVVLEGLREFESALLRLNGDDRIQAAQNVALPPELVDERFMTEEEKRDRAFITDEEDVPEDEKELTIEQKIRLMTAAEKVAFATRGNKQVRTFLLRDTNRLVALAAITSPAITEPEIVAASNSKTVHQDVLMHILRDKKNNWVRNYQVKLALVNNPKTQLPDAMKLVPTLNGRDLKAVAKSRNVPAGVRNLASSLLKNRRA